MYSKCFTINKTIKKDKRGVSIMLLIEQLRIDLKQAMRDKDKNAKEVVRSLIAKCDEFVKVNKRDMTKDEEIAVVRTLLKQSNESVEGFTAGGRQDLVDEVVAQIEVLNKYLPKQLTESEVQDIVKGKIEELGLDTTNKGILMKHLMPLFADQSDRGMISKIISSYVTK